MPCSFSSILFLRSILSGFNIWETPNPNIKVTPTCSLTGRVVILFATATPTAKFVISLPTSTTSAVIFHYQFSKRTHDFSLIFRYSFFTTAPYT